MVSTRKNFHSASRKCLAEFKKSKAENLLVSSEISSTIFINEIKKIKSPPKETTFAECINGKMDESEILATFRDIFKLVH